MQVPFVCQWQVQAPENCGRVDGRADWAARSCAIACLTMVLRARGCPVSLPDVLTAALERKGWDPGRGWRHGVLVDVLHSFGVPAHRRNWRLLDGHETDYLDGRDVTDGTRRELEDVRRQMLEEGVWRIRRALGSGVPVITSIYRPYGNRSSVGHQVVLLPRPAGEPNEGEITYHDPALRDGESVSCPGTRFWPNWKGTAILLAHPQ